MRDVPDENAHTLAEKTFVIDAPEPVKKRRKRVRQTA